MYKEGKFYVDKGRLKGHWSNQDKLGLAPILDLANFKFLFKVERDVTSAAILMVLM